MQTAKTLSLPILACCTVLASLVLMSGSQPAQARAGDWAQADNVSARLLSASEGAGDLARLPLGLELRLKPGWKAYWRSPGEAGLAPSLDFAATPGATAVSLRFPLPHRFTLLGIDTFGYKDAVVLPFDLAVANPGQAAEIKATLDILVCAEICVPNTLALGLIVPAGPSVPGAEAAIINQYAAQVPGDGRASGLGIESVLAIGAGKQMALEIHASAREPFVAPDIFAEAENASFGRPTVTLAENGTRALIRLPVKGLADTPLTLTLADGSRSVEAHPAVIAAALPTLWERLAGLVPMLGLALLGGFILNFMPCVLPVLSLKLLSVVQQGGRARAQTRAGFLAAAAGILASFLVMATALVVLKASGQTIGWGIQFQQPIFIAAMIALLMLFACNLWGLFEITLPSGWTNRLGQGGENSLAGHFASGAVATLLATPCSAPFLGTAVGFALSGGPVEIFAIFVALAIGLAAPWLLVAARPGLASRLPRPGQWMLRLREIMGFALAATALWLLFVLGAQAGLTVAAGLAAALALVVAALLWHAGYGPGPSVLRSGLGFCAALLVVFGAGGNGLRDGTGPRHAIAWAAFDPDAIKSLVSQGKTIFVDVTADWCLTCQVNKRLVLDVEPVAALAGGNGFLPMKADWTKPDPRIAAFLARYRKFGIPFNIVYGPGAPGGIVLPELLTAEGVAQAIAVAKQAAAP